MPTPTAAWQSSTGFCGVTAADNRGDCVVGSSGNLRVHGNLSTWPQLTRACLRECSKCDRCNFISISLSEKDCSWYRCSVLSKALSRFAAIRIHASYGCCCVACSSSLAPARLDTQGSGLAPGGAPLLV